MDGSTRPTTIDGIPVQYFATLKEIKEDHNKRHKFEEGQGQGDLAESLSRLRKLIPQS
ncbi:MAG: hypothetical protein RLZZ612_1955 [Pseudomonadota bacterium]|jgi:hypothetical protein